MRTANKLFPLLTVTMRRICFLALVVIANSCASSGPAIKEALPIAVPKQAITAIRSDTYRFDWYKEVRPVRTDLERCAADAIEGHFPDLRYISREAFTKAAFPDLPADLAPTDIRHIRVLLENSTFQQRLAPLNLRYIVYMGGNTEIEAVHSWVELGGYMAATAAGASKWKKDTHVSAVVFDLQNPFKTVSAERRTEGTSWVAGLFPFIIGAAAGTEEQACREIGGQLVRILAEAMKMEEQE